DDEREQSGSMLSAPIVTGTPGYAAPEQLEGNFSAIGPATDIYALGLILYQTLTGWLPMRGATQWESLAEVQRKEPAAPSQLRSEISPALDAICLRCLAKKPGDRYPNGAELAKDLRRFLAGVPLESRPSDVSDRPAGSTTERIHVETSTGSD